MEILLKNPLFLFYIPGAYFNAVMICLFVKTLRRNGPIFNPLKAVKLLWPLLQILVKALFFGLIPAVLLSTLVQYIAPSWSLVALAIILLGILFSAIFVHRVMLSDIVAPAKWNWIIVVLTLLQIAAFGSVLFFSTN